MNWAVFYRNEDRNFLSLFTDTTKAVNLLLWLKRVRIFHHIIYGIDEIKYDL